MLKRSSFTCNWTGNVRSNIWQQSSYLCPQYIGALRILNFKCCNRRLSLPSQHRFLSPGTSSKPISPDSPHFEKWALERLPRYCPGCGAPTQTVHNDKPGFYELKRHAIRKYLGLVNHPSKKNDKSEIVRLALEKSAHLNLSPEAFGVPSSQQPSYDREIVKCSRCRNLLNHRIGKPIHHPSVESIYDTIHQTPYKYNHVYHVVDAADFPMSIIPNLQDALKTSPLRSRNRRSKYGKFYKGKNIEMSFIITRSDLLAPLKEHVDSMMPYLRATLRDALGRSAIDVRLGNIRCVSVKRGWWNKELREEVWNRGGSGWLVGKVNVGKSQLFGSIFPKGRKDFLAESKHSQSQKPSISQEDLENNQDKSNFLRVGDTSDSDIEQTLKHDETGDIIEQQSAEKNFDASRETEYENLEKEKIDEDLFDVKSLLPPAPTEVNYPTLPSVSDLPGTTAAPIRLRYGNGKGELIDLPGLNRGDLARHVLPAYHSQLMMSSRIEPVQDVIKPGQSLLLGGFIRITPTAPDIVILAYAFTPMKSHVTNREKAIGTQTGTRTSSIMNIAEPNTGTIIASAGRFLLKWDVTKRRTGSVTAPDAGKVSVNQLPYRVLATDILIEGCGWVELVAQVSKRRGDSIIKPLNPDTEDSEIITEFESKDTGEIWPGVEVFSPHGKYVAARRPLNAWSFISKRQSKIGARPKRPISQLKRK